MPDPGLSCKPEGERPTAPSARRPGTPLKTPEGKPSAPDRLSISMSGDPETGKTEYPQL